MNTVAIVAAVAAVVVLLGGICLGALVWNVLQRGKAEARADSLEDGARRVRKQAETLAEELPDNGEMLDGPF